MNQAPESCNLKFYWILQTVAPRNQTVKITPSRVRLACCCPEISCVPGAVIQKWEFELWQHKVFGIKKQRPKGNLIFKSIWEQKKGRDKGCTWFIETDLQCWNRIKGTAHWTTQESYEETLQQANLLQQRHVAEGFILPHAKKAAKDMFLKLKIPGLGFLPQAGISRSNSNIVRWAQVQEMEKGLFCFTPWKLQAQSALSCPCKWLAQTHNLKVEYVTCKIYWVRSTASFFSWRSKVSLSFTVMILTSPRRSSLRPRGRFRTHTLIFSLSVHGVSFSEALDLQQ